MNQESQKPPEERKQDVLEAIVRLQSEYGDYKPQLEELHFMIEQEMLGNNQPFLLTIGNEKLMIARNEDEADMLKKLEDFIATLEGTTPEAAETVAKVEDVVEPLVEGKDKTYWRDVNVKIVAIKHAFKEKELSDKMAELRKTIHNDELGAEDYSIEQDGISLKIDKGDTSEAMLTKLAVFIKEIYRKYPKELKESEVQAREGMEGPEDRQKIWSVILAGLVSLRKAFKATDFGLKIAEIKDLIDDYQLGYVTGYKIEADWGSLEIEKGEDLNSIVEKLATFIEATQKANPDKFDESDIVSTVKAMEEKEAEKIYWTDVIAGLDVLQKTFAKSEYPALQILKEMIENNELGVGSGLLINAGPVVLNIKNTDNDKTIKNKISIFIGALKQIIDQEEGISETYWRDILAQLKGMEDVYGDNPDYQMLIMTIDMGTLATIKDFDITLDGIQLDINITDTDKQLKEKLAAFIHDLTTVKKATVDQQALKKAKAKIKRLEKKAEKIESQYQESMQESGMQMRQLEIDLRRKDDLTHRLRRELENAQRQSSPPVRSHSG